MTKKQAISIITRCAKQYQQYLEGKQVAFVYHDGNNHSNYTAVRFHSHNFLHFTGVTPRQGLNANGFYRAALNNHLSEHDFNFKSNHTTELKLNVLDIIMNIDTKARMIGNYSGPHLDLYTEKVTGTTTACLGLIQSKNCYIPNSVLSEDIRSIIPKPPGKIYAIFKKNINSTLYTQLTYKSQNIAITKKRIPKDLLKEIDSSLLEVTPEPLHNNATTEALCTGKSGIPFKLTEETPNKETVLAMLEAEKIAKDPNVKSSNNVDDLFADLDA